MLQDFLFVGTLVSEQPLANSPPDHSGPRNVAELAYQWVMEDGTLHKRHFIGSSALRAPIRRCCAQVIQEKVGVKYSFPTALEQLVGGAKSSAEVDANPRRRAEIQARNPQLSVFGAGSSPVGFLDSSLAIDMLLAPFSFDPIVVSGARRAEEKTDTLQSMLTTNGYDQMVAWAASNTARSRVKQQLAQAERKITQLKTRGNAKSPEYTETEAEVERLKEELKAREAEAQILGGDVSIGMPLPGYQIMPKGITFPMKMLLRKATDVRIGLLLAGIERFAFNPFIGAHRAHGCGEISGQFTVMTREGYTRWSMLGSFKFNALDGFSGDEEIMRLIDVFRETPISYEDIKGND